VIFPRSFERCLKNLNKRWTITLFLKNKSNYPYHKDGCELWPIFANVVSMDQDWLVFSYFFQALSDVLSIIFISAGLVSFVIVKNLTKHKNKSSTSGV
jgi:hypothetical protein